MARREYLVRQKEEKGRRLFGVFPALYPREILWALNVVPVEIWDPPLEVKKAPAHLQPHICSVVKLGLELILQGKCDILDGFLFPHTCDSIQNLASIVNDFLGLEKPCYFFYHPRAPHRASSRQYYLEQLRGLASELEIQLGPLDITELKKGIEQSQEVAALIRELYELRAHGELGASNTRFYEVIRRGEYLHPDEFLPLLHEFLGEGRGGSQKGSGVILSGILPHPPELLTFLDERGIRVADDDLLNCSRRLLVPRSPAEDPFEALTESYFALPSCTTRGAPLTDRVNDLLLKVERSRAKGVIFNMVKFCEPELFDVPLLVKALRSKGLATLVVDSELNQGLGGQLATRIEAFAEMIG